MTAEHYYLVAWGERGGNWGEKQSLNYMNLFPDVSQFQE